MNTNPITLRFPGCTVLVWNGGAYTETVFEDGTRCPALAQGTEDQVRTARRLGYGDDLDALCREHEILHTLLAVARGLPFSPVLWDVAHDPPDPAPDWHFEEEADVLALQHLLNTGEAEADPFGRLEALHGHVDVEAVLERMREIRGMLRGVHATAA